MEAEGIVVAAETPDVQIVDFVYALNGKDGAGDLFDAHVAGPAFEEDMGGLAQDADAGP